MRPSKCLRVLPPAHRIHPFSRLAAGCTPSTCSPPPPPSPHRCGFTANGGLGTSPARTFPWDTRCITGRFYQGKRMGEHTSELPSHLKILCPPFLEKKKK